MSDDQQQDQDHEEEQPLFNLASLFRNPSIKAATDKILNTAISTGIGFAASTGLREFLFGFILSYLNGATCPRCLTRLGHAKDVPDFTICNACGKTCGKDSPVITVNPLRFKLMIDNNADLFRIIPEEIMMPDQGSSIINQYGPQLLEFYDRVPTELYFEPLVAWIRDTRPDLYYTIALYDNPYMPYFTQVLFEIEMNRFTEQRKREVIKEVGLKEDMSDKQIYDAVVKGMENNIDARVLYYVMNGRDIITKFSDEKEAKQYVKNHKKEFYGNLDYFRREGINGYALKTFFHQIDTLKNGLRELVAKELDREGRL